MIIRDQVHLLIDGSHGIYVPYKFAWGVAGSWEGIDPEDLTILKTGPGHPLYNEAWDNILFSAHFTDSEQKVWHLWQEGDLFAYTGNGDQFT